MQTGVSLVKFLLIFLFTGIGLFAAFKVLVKPCDVFTPIAEDEVRCECLGVKFNLDNWLGNPAEDTAQTQCFGIVTSVVQ